MKTKENNCRHMLLALLLYVPIVHLLGVFLVPELLYGSPYGFFTDFLKPYLVIPYFAEIFPVCFVLPPLLAWYRLKKGEPQGIQLFKQTVVSTLLLAVLCSAVTIYTGGDAQRALLLAIAPLTYSLLLRLLSGKMAAENTKLI